MLATNNSQEPWSGTNAVEDESLLVGAGALFFVKLEKTVDGQPVIPSLIYLLAIGSTVP
jgi:hypothetical protein